MFEGCTEFLFLGDSERGSLSYVCFDEDFRSPGCKLYSQRERDSRRSKDSKQQIFRRASNAIIFAEIHKRADTHTRTHTIGLDCYCIAFTIYWIQCTSCDMMARREFVFRFFISCLCKSFAFVCLFVCSFLVWFTFPLFHFSSDPLFLSFHLICLLCVPISFCPSPLFVSVVRLPFVFVSSFPSFLYIPVPFFFCFPSDTCACIFCILFWLSHSILLPFYSSFSLLSHFSYPSYLCLLGVLFIFPFLSLPFLLPLFSSPPHLPHFYSPFPSFPIASVCLL